MSYKETTIVGTSREDLKLSANAIETRKCGFVYFVDEVGCDMVVLNMPILDTRGRSEDDPTGELISKLVLTIFAWMAEQETKERRRLQLAGIEVAKREGKYKGRQPIEPDKDRFARLLGEVERGERTNKFVMDTLGLKKTTYYKLVDEYKTKTGRFSE